MSGLSFSSRSIRRARRIVHLPQRAFLLNKNSSPYISGDAFADFSDYQAFAPKYRKVKNQDAEIKNAEVVFCPSHKIEELIAEAGRSLNPKVLILGNSDREFHDFDFEIPKSVKHVFAQNMLFPNSNFATAIPIGIENLRLNMNGHPRLYERSINARDSKILVGPLGMTHPERLELLPLKDADHHLIKYVDGRLSPRQYSKLAKNYTYIAAPRGNGIDTHRLWETLYRGAFPIVRQSTWLSNFQFLKKLAITVPSWRVEDLKSSVSNNKLEFYSPNSVPEIWLPYWRDLIKSKI